MKLVTLFCTGLLCAVTSVQAAVFVYKNNIKFTDTGGGTATKLAGGGWTVIDDSGHITQVLAFPAQKNYAIIPLQSIETGTVSAAGKEYSFFIQHDQWSDSDSNLHVDTGGAKGMNVATSINGTSYNIPKTYAWAGRSMGPADSGGTKRFEESSGTMSYDSKWTATCNAQNDTVDSAVQRLADALNQQGYQSL
jgi:hypothetical protein